MYDYRLEQAIDFAIEKYKIPLTKEIHKRIEEYDSIIELSQQKKERVNYNGYRARVNELKELLEFIDTL